MLARADDVSVIGNLSTLQDFHMTKSAFKPSLATSAVQATKPITSNAASTIEVKAVIAYPSLVTPDPMSGDKYNALFLIQDPDDQVALDNLVRNACEDTFRTSELPHGAHNPLRDANERNHAGEYAFKHAAFRAPGAMVVRAKTGFPPCVCLGA